MPPPSIQEPYFERNRPRSPAEQGRLIEWASIDWAEEEPVEPPKKQRSILELRGLGGVGHLRERGLQSVASRLVVTEQLVDLGGGGDDLPPDCELVGVDEVEDLIERRPGLLEPARIAQRLGHRDHQAQPGTRISVVFGPQTKIFRGRQPMKL